MKYHYTYYSYEEWGRGYIGKRSCKCKPEEDVRYFGSYRDKTFKPTQKIILETYDTAEEALDAEIKLQRFFEVVENSHFANQAYQTSTGFRGNRESTRKAREAYLTKSTPEQRSETAKKAAESLTPEQRSERSRKANASLTPKQRSERSRKANASRTPEQRSEAIRKGRAKLTPEQRSEISKKAAASLTPEQRSETAKKASSQMFQCTETGFIANAGGLAMYQKARGIDTSKRIRIN